MNQICTNKEQSHRLLEAGVRPETADMVLLYVDDESNIAPWEDIRKDEKGKFFYDVYGETYTLTESVLLRDSPDYDHSYQDDCPAWSLSKLINMLPATISQRNRPDLSLEITKDSVYWFIQYTELGYDCKHEVMKKNVLDAVVNMIEWLIKEGYLDKKYLTDKCGDCRLIEDEDANGDAWCAFHQKPVRCDSRACEDILKKGGSNEE